MAARCLLLLIEMLLQREVSMRVKETALKLGFVFLMMVVVFVILQRPHPSQPDKDAR